MYSICEFTNSSSSVCVNVQTISIQCSKSKLSDVVITLVPNIPSISTLKTINIFSFVDITALILLSSETVLVLLVKVVMLTLVLLSFSEGKVLFVAVVDFDVSEVYQVLQWKWSKSKPLLDCSIRGEVRRGVENCNHISFNLMLLSYLLFGQLRLHLCHKLLNVIRCVNLRIVGEIDIWKLCV